MADDSLEVEYSPVASISSVSSNISCDTNHPVFSAEVVPVVGQLFNS
jgi:hypothetical protein